MVPEIDTPETAFCRYVLVGSLQSPTTANRLLSKTCFIRKKTVRWIYIVKSRVVSLTRLLDIEVEKYAFYIKTHHYTFYNLLFGWINFVFILFQHQPISIFFIISALVGFLQRIKNLMKMFTFLFQSQNSVKKTWLLSDKFWHNKANFHHFSS